MSTTCASTAADGHPPAGERLEMALTVLVFALGGALAAVAGWLLWLVVLVLLPARLNALGLGWGFDYPPQCSLGSDRESSRFRSTRNRIGFERLLSPLALDQNYHLVHHLHPVAPFYRYIRVWRRNKRQDLARDPALSTVGGRALTPPEYRSLRALGQ